MEPRLEIAARLLSSWDVIRGVMDKTEDADADAKLFCEASLELADLLIEIHDRTKEMRNVRPKAI